MRFTEDRTPTCSRTRIASYTVLLAQRAASAIASYDGEALAGRGVVEAPEQRGEHRQRLRADLAVGLAFLLVVHQGARHHHHADLGVAVERRLGGSQGSGSGGQLVPGRRCLGADAMKLEAMQRVALRALPAARSILRSINVSVPAFRKALSIFACPRACEGQVASRQMPSRRLWHAPPISSLVRADTALSAVASCQSRSITSLRYWCS